MLDMSFKTVVSLLLVVVGVCLAQQKCCSPDQYESLLERSEGLAGQGQGQLSIGTVQYAFDYTNRRSAGLYAVESLQGFTQSHLILDYKKGCGYVFSAKNKTCHTLLLSDKDMPHCIPSDAVYHHSVYLGDDSSRIVDTFIYYYNTMGMAGNMTVGVYRGSCIPSATVFFGSQGGVPTLVTVGFANYTKGIPDPSKYFTVPSYCPQSCGQTMETGKYIRDILQYPGLF